MEMKNQELEIPSELYETSIYQKALNQTEKYFKTPAIKIGLKNFSTGASSKQYPEFMKLISLFILDESIKNAIDRLELKDLFQVNIKIIFFL